ncbi:uncharacterized protein C8Q71DRAFT_728758 [Rhodofomes roseus]|uniref:Protein kinase domain-containing protein n=2 Tax=Rhodofomes roseus TaxID=34475 RepID=A0ABQ8KYB8_9APHY|nr:uncharacterized protein C8Q71DRAFT_728758 [Rhodofomes roseus]KAH9843517.1 hypothetical protein C8Q71DRAFT_728758 [Rhodofomes roseus]
MVSDIASPSPPIMLCDRLTYVQFSPRKPSSAGGHAHSAHSTSEHRTLTQELLGRVAYDQDSVFERLRIFDEDATVIDRCHGRYQVEQAQNLEDLVGISRDPDVVSRGVSRGDGNEQTWQDRKHQETEVEAQMYGPLQNIFDFLTDFDGPQHAQRRFIMASNSTHHWEAPESAEEAYTPGFARSRPDFDLVRGETEAHYWDSYLGFAEIMVDPTENEPPRDLQKTVANAVLQCADHARIHLSCRQFWIFTVVLLITGTDFRVMIVDHGGVLLSPLHSIIDDSDLGSAGPRDAKTFVRVVRALTRLLSDDALGKDPSASSITRRELEGYAARSGENLSRELRTRILPDGDGTRFPSYLVSFPESGGRTWCTIGPPIWVSSSLLGRATTVWRVIEVVYSENVQRVFAGRLHVLKSSWRDPRRSREADIYTLISTFEDCPAGIPQLVCGGDVTYDVPPTMKKLTTAAIRGAVEGPESRVLHRIILNIVGEPLWRYTDELQLLCAFRDIVQVHQYLYEKGILHRDISPGNMFLWTGPLAAAAGFLSDLDMARVDESVLGHPVHQEVAEPVLKAIGPTGERIMTQPAVRTHIRFTETKPRGMPITGTLQFMALQLLEAMDNNQPIEHTVVHDLESIGSVLGYSILRRLLTIPRHPGPLSKVFKDIFGAMEVKRIVLQRTRRQPLSWYVEVKDAVTKHFITDHLSPPVAEVMNCLERAIKAAHEADRNNEKLDMYPRLSRDSSTNAVCTHAYFLGVLNEAIEELEQTPSLMKRVGTASQ